MRLLEALLPGSAHTPRQGRTAVYEFRDAWGRLLYVGVTNSPRHRFAQHAADKHWWPDVDPSLTRITWYPTRAKALRVEERRIKAGGTRHNVIHNPRIPRQRQGSRSRRRYRAAWAERTAAVSLVGVGALGGEVVGFWNLPPVWTFGVGVATAGAGWLTSRLVKRR